MDILNTRDECKDQMLVKDENGKIIGIDNTALSGRIKNNELLGRSMKLFTDKVESVNINHNHNYNFEKELEELANDDETTPEES